MGSAAAPHFIRRSRVYSHQEIAAAIYKLQHLGSIYCASQLCGPQAAASGPSHKLVTNTDLHIKKMHPYSQSSMSSAARIWPTSAEILRDGPQHEAATHQ